MTDGARTLLALTPLQAKFLERLTERLARLNTDTVENTRVAVDLAVVKRGIDAIEAEIVAREGAPREIRMREPCKRCFNTDGIVTQKSGQDVVRCKKCETHCYNAPRTETGREKRSVSTVHEAIKPRSRAAVLERATGRCELCGARPTAERGLHVGHLISVDHGLEHGLTDAEINSEENLCALCAECNLGMGKRSLPLRLAVAMVLVRLKEARKGA